MLSLLSHFILLSRKWAACDEHGPITTPNPALLDFVHEEAAFIPFSVGSMNCIGEGFAMQVMWMMLCSLLQRFMFRLRPGWDPEEYEAGYKDYTVSTRPLLPVVVERR